MAIIIPTLNPGIKIADIREQVKLIIEAALPDQPRVHSSWKLKADMSKSVSLFQRKSDQKIYSWMIGTESNVANKSPNGDYEFVGGTKQIRAVKLVIWGFYDYQLFKEDSQMNSQEFIENEFDILTQFFAANKKLGFDATQNSIRSVQPFDLDNLDVHSFADGVDAHVAQCSMRVLLHR